MAVVMDFSTKTYVVTPLQNGLTETGSNEGSQNMFLWRNMENYPCTPYLRQGLHISSQFCREDNLKLCISS